MKYSFALYLTRTDEGISGTNTKKRDQFNKMIKDCKAGKIDMIITKSISRFARNTLDCLNYIRELKEFGVGVIFEKESINTLDAKGEVLITIPYGHTCASLLLNKGKENGVTMKDIQSWLGHSDFATTANTYSHLDASSKAMSLSTLSEVANF